MNPEEIEDFETGFKLAAQPLMKWLAENMHPHTTAIIDSNSAVLGELTMCYNTDEFLVD